MWSTTHLELTLPPSTDARAEELIEAGDFEATCRRTDEGLVVRVETGVSSNALSNARWILHDVELALGSLGPPALKIVVWQVEQSP
jgi:hypothetical protein